MLELYNGTAWLPVGVLNAKTVTTTYSHIPENSYLLIQTVAHLQLHYPQVPAAGDVIRFFDLRKTFDSAALTIGRNGKLIQGDSADMTVSPEGAAFDPCLFR